MNRAEYNIISVTRETYLQLLEYAIPYCDSFILVLRHSLDVSPKAIEVLSELEPYLICREERKEWPGTLLLDETAQVNKFSFSPSTAEILAKFGEHLYSWTLPHLPEDLCLIRIDGSPWLVSIAHEQDAFLSLAREEWIELSNSIPALHCESNGMDGFENDL